MLYWIKVLKISNWRITNLKCQNKENTHNKNRGDKSKELRATLNQQCKKQILTNTKLKPKNYFVVKVVKH
jgi:hypothetical protein